MDTSSIVNFCNAEMNNPKLLGKQTLVGVGILIGGKKVLQLSAAALTTVGAKVTDIYSKYSDTNKWFHQASDACIASSKQHLVRDLTVAAAMIGAGLSIDAQEESAQEVISFDGVKNKALNGLSQVIDFSTAISYKVGSQDILVAGTSAVIYAVTYVALMVFFTVSISKMSDWWLSNHPGSPHFRGKL